MSDSNTTLPTTDQEWRKKLTPEQYRILREKGTEAPGSGEYDHHYQTGRYVCAACGNEIFVSQAKYDSGSGWPSFYEPARADSVVTRSDTSHGMQRIEVACSRCGGHLGHVFSDGPQPTGQRYCINSAALKFKEEEARQ